MKILLTFALISTVLLSQAQISSGGIPKSFELKKHKIEIDNYYQVREIAGPDQTELNIEDDHAEKNGKPFRVAVNVATSVNISNHGTWTELENGAKIWRLGIKISDAKALGVYFKEKLIIPEGGKLHAYNKTHSQFIGAFTSASDNFSALEMIQGDEVTLEYYMPIGQTILPNIDIEKVGYFYRGVGERIATFRDGRPVDIDRADACQVDVACSEITGWESQRDAVVRYTFVLGQGTFLCTGSVINNTAEDCTPYVLTANHCGDPTSSSDIQNHVWYFNYQRPACSVGNTTPYNGALSQTMSGGFFRASSQLGTHIAANNSQVSGSDFALLELSGTIPTAYNPYYAGWSKTNAASSSGVGIHHPSGHEKKISTYTISLSSSTYNGGWSGAHWQVFWSATTNGHGVTEGGSSGSPIFNTAGKIVGHLSGGASFCTATNQSDLYGKFNKAWSQDGTTASSQIKSWLDPLNTGVLELDGSYTPCSSSGDIYCEASSVTCDEYISNVTVGGISNSTACTNYALYWQNNPIILERSATYYLQISTGIVGNSTIGYTGDQIGAWMDWNADGDFIDAGEQVYSHTISASTTVPLQTVISVPPTAELGEIRMRVRITYDIANDGPLSPCGISNYGEVEDYVIKINPSSLSLGENDAESILIYPNPTAGVVNIDFGSLSSKIEEIEVVDISGKTQFVRRNNTMTTQLDLAELSAGLYIIKFKTGNKTYLRKIVIE